MGACDLSVLVLNDEPTDVELIREALSTAGVTRPMAVVSNGDQAISYLEGAGEFRDRVRWPLPELILVDQKMSGMSGIEFLRWKQAQTRWQPVPVVVLTSSERPAEVNAAFAAGAHGFMVNPIGLPELEEVIGTIVRYWALSLRPKF